MTWSIDAIHARREAQARYRSDMAAVEADEVWRRRLETAPDAALVSEYRALRSVAGERRPVLGEYVTTADVNRAAAWARANRIENELMRRIQIDRRMDKAEV